MDSEIIVLRPTNDLQEKGKMLIISSLPDSEVPPGDLVGCKFVAFAEHVQCAWEHELCHCLSHYHPLAAAGLVVAGPSQMMTVSALKPGQEKGRDVLQKCWWYQVQDPSDRGRMLWMLPAV